MLPAEVVHRHSVPVLIESMCTHTHEGKSKILTVFVLVWAPRDIGLHRLDQQCAHAWAFQAVQTVWLCCRKAVPYCGNLGACCLLPFAVVSCARAKGRFHSPLRMCHPGGLVVVLCGPIQPNGRAPSREPFQAGLCCAGVVRDMRALAVGCRCHEK